MGAYVAITAAAVAGRLWAEYAGSRAGVWIFKPIASTGFVLAALSAGALESDYGRVLFGGLVLAWLGDVLLIPREQPAVFKAGVVAFLLGHVAYTAAFVVHGFAPVAGALAAVATAAVGGLIFSRLSPRIPEGLRRVAAAYVVVISIMVVAAAACAYATAAPAILVGATAFYASDISVARDRFVEHAFINKLWGTPLYYAAQLVLASTVA